MSHLQSHSVACVLSFLPPPFLPFFLTSFPPNMSHPVNMNNIFNTKWESESDMLAMVQSLLPDKIPQLCHQDRIRLCFEAVHYNYCDILAILLPFWPTTFPYSLTIHHGFGVNDAFMQFICDPRITAYREALMERRADLKFAWISFDDSVVLRDWVQNPLQMRAQIRWSLAYFWTGPVREYVKDRVITMRRVAETLSNKGLPNVTDMLAVHPSRIPHAEHVLCRVLESHEAVLELRGLAESPLFVDNVWFPYLVEKAAYPALHAFVDAVGAHVNPSWIENSVYDLLYAPRIPQRLLAKQLRRLHMLVACRGFPTQLVVFVEVLSNRDIRLNSQTTALVLRLALHHEKALHLLLLPVDWSARSVDQLVAAMTTQEIQHVRRARGDSLFARLETSRAFQKRVMEETLVALVRIRRFTKTVMAQKTRGECMICMDTHTLYALHEGDGVHCHRTCWDCKKTLTKADHPRCPLCRVDIPRADRPISTIGKWYLSQYHSELRYDYDSDSDSDRDSDSESGWA